MICKMKWLSDVWQLWVIVKICAAERNNLALGYYHRPQDGLTVTLCGTTLKVPTPGMRPKTNRDHMTRLKVPKIIMD
jgi:hypothetical protein